MTKLSFANNENWSIPLVVKKRKGANNTLKLDYEYSVVDWKIVDDKVSIRISDKLNAPWFPLSDFCTKNGVDLSERGSWLVEKGIADVKSFDSCEDFLWKAKALNEQRKNEIKCMMLSNEQIYSKQLEEQMAIHEQSKAALQSSIDSYKKSLELRDKELEMEKMENSMLYGIIDAMSKDMFKALKRNVRQRNRLKNIAKIALLGMGALVVHEVFSIYKNGLSFISGFGILLYCFLFIVSLGGLRKAK